MALVEDFGERELVESHKRGDSEAFRVIVETYRGSLLGHARRRLGDPAAAEDAVQETLLRAYRALPRFNGQYKLGAWLHRICENVCVDEGNRRTRELGLVTRLTADEDRPEAPAAPDTNPQVDLEGAVASLPPQYREALYLRYVEGRPYRELADAAGISEENARARVHRARAVLRRVLAGAIVVWATLLAMLRRPTKALAESAGAHVGSAATSMPIPVTELLLHASAAPDRMAVMAKVAAAVVAVALPVASVGIATAPSTTSTPEGLLETAAGPSSTLATTDLAVAADAPDTGGAQGAESQAPQIEIVIRVDQEEPEPETRTEPRSAPIESQPAPPRTSESQQSESPPPTTSSDSGTTGATSETDQVVPDKEKRPVHVELPAARMEQTDTTGRSDIAASGALIVGVASIPGRFSLSITDADPADPTAPQRLLGSFVSTSGASFRLRFYGDLLEATRENDTIVYKFSGTYRRYGADIEGVPAKGVFDAVYTVRTDGSSAESLQIEVRPAVRTPALAASTD